MRGKVESQHRKWVEGVVEWSITKVLPEIRSLQDRRLFEQGERKDTYIHTQ